MNELPPHDESSIDNDRPANKEAEKPKYIARHGRSSWLVAALVVAGVAGFGILKTIYLGNPAASPADTSRSTDPQAVCTSALDTVRELYGKDLQQQLSAGGTPIPADAIAQFIVSSDATADGYNANVSTLTCSATVTFRTADFCNDMRSRNMAGIGNAAAVMCFASMTNAQTGQSPDSSNRVSYSIKPTNGGQYVQLIDAQ